MPRRRKGWPSFWKDRAAPFSERVNQLSGVFEGSLTRIGELEANAVFVDRLHEIEDIHPSSKWLVVRGALHYAYYSGAVTHQLLDAANMQWKAGDFIAFSLSARLVFEYAGALSFCQQLLAKADGTEDWERASRKTATLLLGTRHAFWLGYLQVDRPKSIHVMDFVRARAVECAEAESDYDFLCECCHPNFLHHYYYYNAGAAGDLYSSASTEHEIKLAFERTISITETAVSSAKSSLGRVADRVGLIGPDVFKQG